MEFCSHYCFVKMLVCKSLLNWVNILRYHSVLDLTGIFRTLVAIKFNFC